jgi:predicted Zn-dependent protease
MMTTRAILNLLAIPLVAAQPINSYSLEKEAALGAELAKEVRRTTHPLEGAPTAQQYLTRIALALRPGLPDPHQTFRFTIVADPIGGATHEPCAIPGGDIFAPANLILKAHNEAELAGMLAHSMAHIAERHATRLATQGQMANPGTIPLIIAARCNSNLLTPIGLLKYQRDHELEADLDALRMMHAAGYDPNALRDYIARVEPTAQPRIEHIAQLIKQLPAQANYRESTEFPSIQAQIASLMQSHVSQFKPPTLKRPSEKQ